MLIPILTIATASLLPLAGQNAPVMASNSASVPFYPTYEKHQPTTGVPMHVQFFHRGSGRCEQPNCSA